MHYEVSIEYPTFSSQGVRGADVPGPVVILQAQCCGYLNRWQGIWTVHFVGKEQDGNLSFGNLWVLDQNGQLVLDHNYKAIRTTLRKSLLEASNK